MQNSKVILIVKLVTTLATLLIVALVGVVSFQTIKMKKLEKESETIDTKLVALTSQKQELENGIKNRSSSIYIEEYARNQLGMLNDDEDYFIFE